MPRKSTNVKTADDTNAVVKEVAVKETPLTDSDEIDVVSLIPNVSYKDSRTNDMYQWEEIGHIEAMTFETIKNMWRNYKSYFKNMWLKPMDDRVVKQFGLQKDYERYDFLMDEKNYTRNNIASVCDSIESASDGTKYTICNRIKNLISSEKITDAIVIRALERKLDLDLMSLL